MTPLQIRLIILSVIFAIGAGGGFYFTKGYYVNKYETTIAKMEKDEAKAKKELAEKITELTNEKIEIERKLGESRNEIDVEHNKAIENLNARIESLRRDNVRLRDPGASKTTSCTPRDPGATGSASEGDETAGLLSRQTTEFLWDYAREADGTLEELRSCKKWVDEVRRITEENRLKQEKQ